MPEKDREYKPLFSSIYKFLGQVYRDAMETGKTDEEIESRCRIAHIAFVTLHTLKVDGIFAEMFSRLFWEDIQQIMTIVHKDMKTEEFKECQKKLTFAIANLRTDFGGR